MRLKALILVVLLSVFRVAAQPPDPACAAAIACAGQTVAGSNTGATGTMPGFCTNTDGSIWYTFTTNSVGGVVNITVRNIDCPEIAGFGDELVGVVLSANDCEGPFTSASNCVSGSQTFTINTDPLPPLTTYWILIAGEMGTTGAAQCDFELVVGGPGANILGVDIIVSEDVTIGLDEHTQLNVSAPGVPAGTYTYTWSPTTGLSNANISDPIASPATTTNYTVTIDAGDCEYTDVVVVEVIRRISPPNTFTPNGDGRNDFWEIPEINDYPGAEVHIFDRWGQRVYTSTGYREPWDGTNNGARLPDATYYYHIQLNQLEGRSPPYTGFISIIR